MILVNASHRETHFSLKKYYEEESRWQITPAITAIRECPSGSVTADETSIRWLPMHPLEHRTDPKPGNKAGGPGMGVVPQLSDCQRTLSATLFSLRKQQKHSPGDTGADHKGAGCRAYFDKLRSCFRAKPPAPLLDEHPRCRTATGSGAYSAGCFGQWDDVS